MSSAAPLATSSGVTSTFANSLLQRGDVLVELVGERCAALGGVLLEQQELEPVPTGEGGIVDAGEVVDARVDLAVDLLDQPGQRLDALPRHAGRRERVLRGLQVVGPHCVGEYLDDLDELVDLADRVSLVVGCRLLELRARSGGRRRRCLAGRTRGTALFGAARIAAGASGKNQGRGRNRHGPGEMQFH